MTFEKDLIAAEAKPLAEYLTPGHPLLDGTIDLIIERYDSLLRQGAVLDRRTRSGDGPHVLVYLQHAVVDGRADQAATAGSSPSASSSSTSTLRATLAQPGGRRTLIFVRPPPDEISALDTRDRRRVGPR